MKWDKIKKFLIVLLLVVDIFLGVTLLLQYRNISYVSSGNLQRLPNLFQRRDTAGHFAGKKTGNHLRRLVSDDYLARHHLLSGGAEGVVVRHPERHEHRHRQRRTCTKVYLSVRVQICL